MATSDAMNRSSTQQGQSRNLERMSGQQGGHDEHGVSNVANDAFEVAKDKGQKAASWAQDETAHFVSEKKNLIAGALDHVAEAARQMAGSLHDKNDGNLARYTETAASSAERLANYLRDHEPKQMLSDLENTARRHPAMVFGGLFAAGLVASRFLRASQRHQESS